MIDRIKKKWRIENSFQFIVILIVFAVTGSASAGISGPIADYFELDNLHVLLYWPIRLLIVFPVYQILLIWFGFVFVCVRRGGADIARKRILQQKAVARHDSRDRKRKRRA